jgi:phosphoribosylformylglycinamidine synthase
LTLASPRSQHKLPDISGFDLAPVSIPGGAESRLQRTWTSPTAPPAGGAVQYNGLSMKAYVYVSLKKSVLDPQGKTIQGALKKMGYQGLEQVRQGKYFELTLEGGLDRDRAQAEVERIAREVLTNPVIEEFRFSLEDK